MFSLPFFKIDEEERNKHLKAHCNGYRGEEEQESRLRSCLKAIVKVLITSYLTSASYSCCCYVTFFPVEKNRFPFFPSYTKRHITKVSLISCSSRKQAKHFHIKRRPSENTANSCSTNVEANVSVKRWIMVNDTFFCIVNTENEQEMNVLLTLHNRDFCWSPCMFSCWVPCCILYTWSTSCAMTKMKEKIVIKILFCPLSRIIKRGKSLKRHW